MKRCLAMVTLALVALVAPAVFLGGCTCDGPGPYLATTPSGQPAIGWMLEGDEALRAVTHIEDDAVRWQVEAVEPVTPSVVVLGEAPSGFLTVVPADAPIGPDAPGAVVVAYDGGSGDGDRFDLLGADLALQFELGLARTADVEEADGCGLSLPFGGAVRAVAIAAVVAAIALFFVLGGAVGLVAAVRSLVGRRDDGADPD